MRKIRFFLNYPILKEKKPRKNNGREGMQVPTIYKEKSKIKYMYLLKIMYSRKAIIITKLRNKI